MAGRIRNPALRHFVYRFLCIRDGAKCALCGVGEDEADLVIDHVDGNTMNGSENNLRLLCRACNVPRKWPISMDSIPNKCERESASVRGEGLVGLSGASLELRLNRDREPQYRRWITGFLISEGDIPLGDAINSGAEVCRVSPLTTRRYLAKLCSPDGPLTVHDGTKRVMFKPGYFAHLAEPVSEVGKEGEKVD